MLDRFTAAMRAELEKEAAAPEAQAAGPAPAAVASPSPAPVPASAPPLEVSSVVLRQPMFWLAALVIALGLIWFWFR
jgi:hypothetical protein